ncbi:uncharacterized protein BDV14DRAFT_198510 [Aspergillus stella-maris]|uniref:uncharacterized protein n=1 Tax=Aspergillus stella-maris TaxID=1810926 RepID=UPI003CCD914B
MYKHNPSCDCDLQIYLGITPKTPTKGRRWILILVDPDSGITQWFYTKPSRDGGHVHARGHDIPWARNIFSDRIWIGTLPDRYVDFFNKSYRMTRTAPSHVFVANMIKALSKRGMVERAVVDEIRVAAGDSTGYDWGFVNAYSSNIGRDEPASAEERRMSGLSGVLARIGLQ